MSRGSAWSLEPGNVVIVLKIDAEPKVFWRRWDRRGGLSVFIGMTTLEKTERLSPLEKFGVLAGDIDQIRIRLEAVQANQSVDDLLETLDVAELGERFGVSLETMKKRLVQAGGAVIKVGKKHVIRKVRFLEVLESLESQ